MPEVRVVDAEHASLLPDLDVCQVTATADAHHRRKMYQREALRQTESERYEGEYESFLRSCQIRLCTRPLGQPQLQRVHELSQRTNQMNFSGNRYDRSKLEEIMRDDTLDTYVLDCQDAFGSYGTIGFCVIDSRRPLMSDLMFSCRIQSKRVEHAFITYILNKYRSESESDFHAMYRKTPRNAQSGKVFDDFAFDQVEEKDGARLLVFRKDRAVPDDRIITIVESGDGQAA